MRIMSVTVSTEMTVQPKAYNAFKLGISATVQADEDGQPLTEDTIVVLRRNLNELLRSAVREEVSTVYGKAAADYVVNQGASQTPDKAAQENRR